MREAEYRQDFNISEMAKELGMSAGSKIELKMLVNGEVFMNNNNGKRGYFDTIITKARITEAKNGHTTLKIWCLHQELNDWYKQNEVNCDWWMLSYETLEKIKKIFKESLDK